MGLHDYRHFAIAIQKKFMDLSPKPPSDIDQALARLRGHVKGVEVGHYARLKNLGSCSSDGRDHALNLAWQYHKVMGFATGYKGEPPADSKILREEFSYQPPDVAASMPKLKPRVERKTHNTLDINPGRRPRKRISQHSEKSEGPSISAQSVRRNPARSTRRPKKYEEEDKEIYDELD